MLRNHHNTTKDKYNQSRETFVAWVFVVWWFENQTITQVMVNRSLKWDNQRSESMQNSTDLQCAAQLWEAGTGQGREWRDEAGYRYVVIKKKTKKSKQAQERLWHSFIPGELPHTAFSCLTFLSYLSIRGAECISFKSILFFCSLYKAAYFTILLHLKKKNKKYALLMKIST